METMGYRGHLVQTGYFEETDIGGWILMAPKSNAILVYLSQYSAFRGFIRDLPTCRWSILRESGLWVTQASSQLDVSHRANYQKVGGLSHQAGRHQRTGPLVKN